MPKTYSVYEAKTHFSELLRRVQSGQRVVISVRGEEVAEIRSIVREQKGTEERIRELQERGLITPPVAPKAPFAPLANRRGALARFLTERE